MSVKAHKLKNLLRIAGVRQAQQQPEHKATAWNRDQLSGRLVELSATGASASMTCAMALVKDAQDQHEPVAWITGVESTFFPPDAARSGIDLEALVVVRVPSAAFAARAADRLIRSGAMGLVVLDLGKDANISMAQQGRLVSLAQKHDTAVVCLTDKRSDSASMGSMVSLRAEVLREPMGEGHFRCKVHVLKDKRCGPGWSHSHIARGPAGLG